MSGDPAELSPRLRVPGAAVVVPPGESLALAEAIESTLGDRQLRDQVAAAARQWTLAHDADWTAVEFDRLYRAAAPC